MKCDCRPTRKWVVQAVCDGEMDQVWKAIKSELDCDITIEYEGGPVQIRFGDYISESTKRVPLKKVVSKLITAIREDMDDLDYYSEIASALIREGSRIQKAVDRVQAKKI